MHFSDDEQTETGQRTKFICKYWINKKKAPPSSFKRSETHDMLRPYPDPFVGSGKVKNYLKDQIFKTEERLIHTSDSWI